MAGQRFASATTSQYFKFMSISSTQVDYIYKRIHRLFPAEMTDYNDNKLWKELEKLSLADYKYLLAQSYNKQDDVIINYFRKVNV